MITLITFLCTFFSVAPITVMIRVSRINELNPSGITLAFTFSLLENSPADILVGKSTFTDGDWPFNNIKYNIVGGNIGTPNFTLSQTHTVKMLISISNKNKELIYTHLEFILLRNSAYWKMLKNSFLLNYAMFTLVC